jgi:hypothetical protein
MHILEFKHACFTLKVFGEVSITELSILKESTPVVIVPTALRTSKKKNMIVQLHQLKQKSPKEKPEMRGS